MSIFEINIFWVTIAPSYYWLMYAIWFMAWYYIIKKRGKISSDMMDDLFLYIFIWVIAWGRLWYTLFYNLPTYISDPLSILRVWEWWMSFHGWVIWVIFAMILFAKKKKISFLMLADQITLILPIWLWFWRIWNYINKELLWFSPYNWVLAVEKWWNMYFPSPLLESFLEGFVLYFILLFFYKRKHNNWQIASLFLIFYAIFRIFVESLFRTPDIQIWYILWYFTMWEILSLPMLVVGLILYFRFWKS